MDTKIFLQGFANKSSSNTSEGLNVEFKGKRKLLPLNDVAEVISQNDQYLEERKNCNIIRLTCKVNPICSNVLFNKITEIVKNEGSSGVTFINYNISGTTSGGTEYANEAELFSGVTYKKKTMSFWTSGNMSYQTTQKFDKSHISDMDEKDKKEHYYEGILNVTIKHPTNSIRDTQLSNKTTSFIYHCGLDIFNNHLIRSKTFKTVCRMPDYKSMYNPSAYTNDYAAFNTIADLMRDVNGIKVIEKVYFPSVVSNVGKLTALHLYEFDDLDTFKNAVQTKLVKKYNGWLGFENKSKIKSYANFVESEEMEIERPLMYMNGGDFVDMYPSRDLYSFVPKYNKFRKRIEKNWNYCLTYPSHSYAPNNTGDCFSDIILPSSFTNSLRAAYFDENTRSDNGTKQIVIYSVAKHGLNKGDYVNIYKSYYLERQYWLVNGKKERISDVYDSYVEANDALKKLEKEGISVNCGEIESIEDAKIVSSDTNNYKTVKVLDSAEVVDVVDDYIFTVFSSDVQISNKWVYLSKQVMNGVSALTYTEGGVKRTYKIDDLTSQYLKEVFYDTDETERLGDTLYYIVNGRYVNLDDNAQMISYKKVVGGVECDYYVRIFSRLPNFKFASGDTSNEYQLYKDEGQTIRDYQDPKYDFESHVSKLAFAKNIYSDEVGEIVFTDDIDISKLHDNLGRPLSSIYLTIVKNNKGYKEWYGYDYSPTQGNHWFGAEISGNTVEYSHAFGKVTCGIETSIESIYDDKINGIRRLTNINDSDLKSPSGYTLLNNFRDKESYKTESGKEVKITSNEVWFDYDKMFYGDLCCYDGYNANEEHISYVMHRFNSAQRESYNSNSSDFFKQYVYDEIETDDYSSKDYSVVIEKSEDNCGKHKEGYYYNPHYEIPIKTFGKLKTVMPDFLTIREIYQVGGYDSNVYRITTLQEHFLSVGDKATIYDRVGKKYYDLVTINGGKDNYKVFTCSVFEEGSENPTPLRFGDDFVVVNLTSSLKTVFKESEIQSDILSLRSFKLFKMDNIDCPNYAKVLKDGTCRIVWRDILNNGFSETQNEIEEYPFTNGAFYINRNVDVYVRRQDPEGDYLLYSSNDIEGVVTDAVDNDTYVKEAEIEC